MVFFISGLSGSGKTVAGEFFTRHGIPVIRMGEVTRKFTASRHLSQGELQEESARRTLRDEHGASVYAVRTLPAVNAALKTSRIVAVEGLRSREEWQYFQDALPESRLLFIRTDTGIRHTRLTRRTDRPLVADDLRIRDAWERDLGTETVQDIAQFVIENNGTKEALYRKLEKVLSDVKL